MQLRSASLLLLLALAACKSSAPAQPADPSPAPSPAASPEATKAAEHTAMIAGCAAAIRAPNAAQYAKRAQEAGAPADAAKAEAEFVLSKATPVFEKICECVIGKVGEEKLKQDPTALSTADPATIAPCMEGFPEAVKTYLPSREELDAFRKDYMSKRQ